MTTGVPRQFRGSLKGATGLNGKALGPAREALRPNSNCIQLEEHLGQLQNV